MANSQASLSDTRQFFNLIKKLSLVLCATFLFSLGIGGLFPTISLSLSQSGHSDFMIGIASSLYFLGTLIGCVLGKKIVRAIFHIKTFCLIASISSITTLGLIILNGEVSLLLLRFGTGLGVGAFYLLVESWFNFESPNKFRGRTMALYETLRMGGISLGPLLIVGSIEPIVVGYVVTSICFITALIPITVFPHKEPSIAPQQKMIVKQVLAKANLSVFLCFSAGIINGTFFALASTFAKGYGWTELQVSSYFSLVLLTPIIMLFPVGYLSDRLGRAVMAMFVAIIACGCSLAISFYSNLTFMEVLILGMIVGGIAHPIYGIGISYAADVFPASEVVSVNGILFIIFSLGTVLGPILAGSVMSLMGNTGLYMFLVFVFSLISIRVLPNVFSKKVTTHSL